MSAVTVERACLHGKAKMEISWCALKEREVICLTCAFNAFKSPSVDLLKLSLEKKNSAQGPGNNPTNSVVIARGLVLRFVLLDSILIHQNFPIIKPCSFLFD